jgi:histidinol-phosphatase
VTASSSSRRSTRTSGAIGAATAPGSGFGGGQGSRAFLGNRSSVGRGRTRYLHADEPAPGGRPIESSEHQAHPKSERAPAPDFRRGTEAERAEWLAFALDCADEADRLSLLSFRRDLRISAKPDKSLVTDVDQAIERMIRERITARYPDHGIVGEEYGTESGGAAVRWYIDPIDGTHNFVRGVPLFGLLLAVERDGIRQVGVLSAPAMRERWYASRGSGAWSIGAVGHPEPRRLRVSEVGRIEDAQLLYGSGASIEKSGRAPRGRALRGDVWRERGFGDFWGYALVAEGAAEGMIEIGVNPWDLAAPEVLVEEAGGQLTDLAGERRIDRLEVLASNGRLHRELMARLAGGGAEPAPGLAPAEHSPER